MRRYDDHVEVRRGRVGDIEGPEQFLWRGRLWKVRTVLARWTETGAWWASREVDAVLGTDEETVGGPEGGAGALGLRSVPDLLADRELWRVEAGRGVGDGAGRDGGTTGVFELSFDHDDGRWALVGCAD